MSAGSVFLTGSRQRLSIIGLALLVGPWLAGCDVSDMAKFKKEMEQYRRQKTHYQQERNRTETDAAYYFDSINGPQRITQAPAPKPSILPPAFNPLELLKQKPAPDSVRLPEERFETRAPVRPTAIPLVPSTPSSPMVPAAPPTPSMPQAPSLPQAPSFNDTTRRDGFR